MTVTNDLNKLVDFSIIRYANCWEDADILLKGLSAEPGSKILSIASAGDNSFSLLTTNPSLVVAIDISTVQLYLTELKQQAIKHMNYTDVLQFFGFTNCSEREKYYIQLKPFLSDNCKQYWDQNIQSIKRGIIYNGKFENYFKLFRKYVLALIHGSKTINKLFSPKTSKQQLEFYSNKWNSKRWKALFKIFFGRKIMGKLGRDPKFLEQVDGSVANFIYKKAENHLISEQAQRNYFLHYIMKGNFGSTLPHYLRKENFDLIKTNINNLVFMQGYAENAFNKYGKFNYMNLSNIFEYMDETTFKTVANQLIGGLEDKGKMAYWNLMVPRRVSEIEKSLAFDKETSEQLTAIDNGFFYSKFIIDFKL